MAICHYNKNVDHKTCILLHQATYTLKKNRERKKFDPCKCLSIKTS